VAIKAISIFYVCVLDGINKDELLKNERSISILLVIEPSYEGEHQNQKQKKMQSESF
jgi:hypothetical protein